MDPQAILEAIGNYQETGNPLDFEVTPRVVLALAKHLHKLEREDRTLTFCDCCFIENPKVRAVGYSDGVSFHVEDDETLCCGGAVRDGSGLVCHLEETYLDTDELWEAYELLNDIDQDNQ